MASGDAPKTADRKKLAATGKAMPDKPVSKGGTGSGGRFPIRNASDLAKAIKAVGRAKPEDRAKVRAFIIRRAKALGLSNMIPSSWSGGSSSSS